MACTLTLQSRLGNNHDTGGYFVYLGYSTTSGINVANENDTNCFGITDALSNSDPNDPYTGTPSSDINITPHTAIPYSGSGNTVNFDSVSPGFYGFMYIVGDVDNSGDIQSPECGDVDCFEVEVIDSPENMVATDFPTLCEANLPFTGILGSPTPATGQVENYLPGGTWSGGVGTISLSGNNTSVTIPLGTTPGVYVFTYTVSAAGTLHTVDPNCTDCTYSVQVSIEITAQQSAGEGNSIAVCN